MSEHDSGHSASVSAGPVDHELSYRSIGWFVAGIAILSLAAFAGMWILSSRLKAGSIARDPAASPMPEANQPRPRPRAALQADPTADMQKFRAEEDAVLSSYRWVDKSAGIARIPVSRAIDLLAERGLPSVPAPAPAKAAAAPVKGAVKTAPVAVKK